MNFWDILAGIIATLISATLYLALWNEICVEMRARGKTSPVPCEALKAWYGRRREGRETS